MKTEQVWFLFSSVQSLSCVQQFASPWTAARQAPLFFIIFQSMLKLMFIESVILSNHLILCHPLLLLPSIFSSIRIFSNESALCIRRPKYWSFSISPPKEYSRLISVRINWFAVLAAILPGHSCLPGLPSVTSGGAVGLVTQRSHWSVSTNADEPPFQLSLSVVSNSLWPHWLQHAGLLCPSPTPRACSNSHLLSRWCHPTISSFVIPFSSCLQSFPASVFSNESVLCIRWPKYWSFSFNINPYNEYSGLISFRIDRFDLLAVQGTLKSLLQHHIQKHQFEPPLDTIFYHCQPTIISSGELVDVPNGYDGKKTQKWIGESI